VLDECAHVRRAKVSGGSNKVVEVGYRVLAHVEIVIDAKRADLDGFFYGVVSGMVNRNAFARFEGLRGERLAPPRFKVDVLVDEDDVEVLVSFPDGDAFLPIRSD
jgi:hypothetical protein